MVVTKFEIENQQLVFCPGRLVVERLGVLGIELSYELDQTIIETETDLLYFSPLGITCKKFGGGLKVRNLLNYLVPIVFRNSCGSSNKDTRFSGSFQLSHTTVSHHH